MSATLPPTIRLAAELRDQADWGKPAAEGKQNSIKAWRAKMSLCPIDGMLLVASYDDIPAATAAATQVCTAKMAKDTKSGLMYRLDPDTKEHYSVHGVYGLAASPDEAAIKAAVAARGEKKFAEDLKEAGFQIAADLPAPGPEEQITLTIGKPMMPLVKPREMESRVQPPVLLTDAQCAAANVKPGTWACGSLPSTLLPKTSGCIRGMMPRYGMFAEPSDDGNGCTLTQVALFDMCGSLPSVLLNSFNDEALKSFDNFEKVSRELLKENGGKVVTPQDVLAKWQ